MTMKRDRAQGGKRTPQKTPPVVENLRIETICMEVASQVRVQRNQKVIKEYAESMRNFVHFPPVIVYFDGKINWLADGVHRLEAAKRADKDTIRAEIRRGGRREALLCAVEENSTHGIRATNEDKRQAVTLLLADPEWVRWSDGEIARRCGVSDRFVGKVRRKVSPNSSGMRNVTRRGKTFRMKTSGIGAKGDQEAGGSSSSGSTPGLLGAVDSSRSSEEQFDVILVGPPTCEKAAERIIELASPDCVVWHWTNRHHLNEALDRLDGWGFTYGTLVTWPRYRLRKSKTVVHETDHFVVGFRGKPNLDLAALPPFLSQADVSEYAHFTMLRDKIARTSPGRKVELFARTPCEGWVTRTYNPQSGAWEEVTSPATVDGLSPA
jgi:hypothetical protein